MYKELIPVLKDELAKFDLPEMERRSGSCGTAKGAENARFVDYVVYRDIKADEFYIKLYDNDGGDYVFSGGASELLARLQDVFMSEEA